MQTHNSPSLAIQRLKNARIQLESACSREMRSREDLIDPALMIVEWLAAFNGLLDESFRSQSIDGDARAS